MHITNTLRWSRILMFGAIIVMSGGGPAANAAESAAVEQTSVATVTGTVVDEEGEPLIEAVVRVKDTQLVTVTDQEGKFYLNTDGVKSPVITVQYVGYKTAQVDVAGTEPLTIVMKSDAQAFNEVVVTAFGIKRNKKMLGYAVQDVKSDELNTTGDPSVISALDGKVAGVQMSTASTGLGGSTKITIRGNSSLTDNNQPLWIVDGVPFSDNNSSGVSAFGGYDRGGTAFDINPEDIESISVLKGPNAAALYGSRAGNGVILVTTKRGSGKKGFGLTYNGSFTWSKATEAVEMQTIYGQGSRGTVLYQRDADGNPTGLTGELAFGPRYDGALRTSWTGEAIPYQNYGNKLTDYFRTGFSQYHTFVLSNTKEDSNYRLSVGYNDNDGMFPTENLRKFNIDFSAGSTFNRWLKSEGKVSVSNTKAENRPYTGLNGVVGQLLLIPGNVRLCDLKNFSTDERLHQNWFGPDQHYSNPYYVAHRFRNNDERWRAFGFYSLNLDINPWLKAIGKYAFDYYRTRIEETNLGLGDQAITTGDDSWQSKLTNDAMSRNELNFFEHNISLNITGDNYIGDKWRLGYTVGGNIMYQDSEGLAVSVENMLEKDNWIFNTADHLSGGGDSGYNRAMYSVYGSVQTAFREFLSLDLTARNDWSSTLPSHHRSFFYPSANLSFVFTDFIREMHGNLPQWVTFGKVRLSAAQVGKDPDPYNLYNTRQFQFQNGVRVPVVQTIKMNSNLKPEIKTSYEAGIDFRLFNNRLGVDFTYYDSKTKNQAMLIDASAPWNQQWVNAGCISNRGFELMLTGRVVETNDFTFGLTANLAHNRSTVDELADGVSRVYFAGDGNMPVKVGAVAGGKLGNIYANRLMKRNEAGQLILDANGLPQPETGGGNLEQYLLDHPIGNIQPDLLMSVTPTFRWKNLYLSAMFDMKFGGDIVSVSEGMATMVGTSQRTANRGEFKTVNGVDDYYMVVDGVDANGAVNSTPVSAQAYYSTIGLYLSQQGYAEEFVHDASYIKLKELSLGYSLPKKWLSRTPINGLRLSLVARNLCFLMKHTPGNPEGGYDTSMFSQALDFMAMPYARTYGLTVNVEF